MTRTLGELAAFLEGELQGPADLSIEGIASLDQATPREISFITQGRFARLTDQSRAAAFIVSQEYAGLARPLIIVPHPYLAYARVAALFAPPVRRWPGISDLAYLGPEVVLGQEVSIAPLAFIGAGVRLGDRVTIMPGCVINDEVRIGADTLIYPNVTIRERCTVGERCIIHSGTVIGSDGFGFVPQEAGHVKIPQLGTVVIEDDVEIGANCTIDRGALGATRIGPGRQDGQPGAPGPQCRSGGTFLPGGPGGGVRLHQTGQKGDPGGAGRARRPYRTGGRRPGGRPIRRAPLHSPRPDVFRLPGAPRTGSGSRSWAISPNSPNSIKD